MIPESELKKARKLLQEAQNRIYFYDDDADGSCSYLHLYKEYPGEGIVVKDGAELPARYWDSVERAEADLIIILDKPMVEYKLLKQAEENKIPVIYIDHHPPVKINKNVTYINPRVYDMKDGRSTSYWAAILTKKPDWIALSGAIADYTFPEDLLPKFGKENPELFDPKIKNINEAREKSKLGLLGKIIDSNMRGKVKTAVGSINALKRIETPDEILEQTTRAGKYVWKKYAKFKEFYDEMRTQVEITDEPVIYFKYVNDEKTVSAQLATELGSKYPKKVVIIGRQVKDEVYFSIRGQSVNIRDLAERARAGLHGRSGGHDHAIGASFNADEADLFVEKLIEIVKKELKP